MKVHLFMPMLVGAHKVPHRRTGRRKSSMHGSTKHASRMEGWVGERGGARRETRRQRETERETERDRRRYTHTERQGDRVTG